MTQRYNASKRIVLMIALLALGAGIALMAQRTGPITGGPRVPGPGAPPPETREPLPPIETRTRQEIPSEGAVFSSDANLVTVEIAVVDSQGTFIPNLPADKFQILEDNVPQQVASFGASEAPMTVCLLIEFNSRF